MNMVGVLVKFLHPDASIPYYATEGASGFDLIAIEDVSISPERTKLVRTGLAMDIPVGFELQIRPRSGLSLNTNLRIANSPGTIDSDYRGEIYIIATNSGVCLASPRIDIKKGDKVAQGVIVPIARAHFLLTEKLDVTIRNDGGFGSTDLK